MTTGSVKSQGTELFVIETASASDPTITKMACPTGIDGLMGGPKDQIETTCLDVTDDKTFVGGLGNPNQITVPFVLIPRETSHQILHTLKRAGTVLKWIACLSESTTDPTMDTDLEFVGPTDRSWIKFDAFILDVNISVTTNEVVRGTLTLQRTGSETAFWYTPA